MAAEGKLKKRPPNAAPIATDQPKLWDESVWAWSAFNALNSQRLFGQHGPQPIQLADTVAYASAHELGGGKTRWLIELINRMDRFYIEETYKKLAADRKREADAAKRKQQSPSRKR